MYRHLTHLQYFKQCVLIDTSNRKAPATQMSMDFRAALAALPRTITLIQKGLGFTHLSGSDALDTRAHSTILEIIQTILEDGSRYIPESEQFGDDSVDLYPGGQDVEYGSDDIVTRFKGAKAEILRSAVLRPLSDLEELDLTIPDDAPLSRLDPAEDINLSNWKEKGMLREYFAGIKSPGTSGNVDPSERFLPSSYQDHADEQTATN